MQLSLENFKKEIASHILQRGRDYYDDGCVVSLEEIGDGHWMAEVEGTELYIVEVEQSGDGGIYPTCTCPYDWGPTCKHIAAVLYAIEDTFQEYFENKPAQPRKKRASRKEKVRTILANLPKQELVEILTEFADNDRQIALALLARFGKEREGKKAYIRLAKDALKMGQGRGGFIDYWGAPDAARGLQEMLNRARKFLRQGKSTGAIPIAQAILETVIPVIEYADDSMGALGECIDSACQILEKAATDLEDTARHELFDYCLSKAPVDPFIEWDWGWFLAQLAADLIATQEERIRLFEMLDQMATHHGTSYDDHSFSSSRFDHERAALIKLAVIQREDGEEAALVFIKKHVNHHPFRQRLIKHYMESDDLEEVKRLCQEWLENYSQEAPGLREEYLGTLLNIAQMEENRFETIRLARELFLHTTKFGYYDLLKQMTHEEEWPGFVEDLINDVEDRSRGKYVQAEIYVREGMWQRLLKVSLQVGEHFIDIYRQHLESRFPDEIFDAYKQILYQKLSRTSSRAVYAEAAEYLSRMDKIGYSMEAREIKRDLIHKYNRRKAMIEELNAALPV
jgi:uncharacterized Zn finger protein